MPKHQDMLKCLDQRLLDRPERRSFFWRPARTAAANVTLFNLDITNSTLEAAVSTIACAVRERQRLTIAFVNAHSANCSELDPMYTRVLNRADIRYADGSGMALAARFAGKPLVDNVNGTDLLPLLAARAEREGLSLYLYGAMPGVAEKAAGKLVLHFPDLKIAGCDHGYRKRGSHEEADAIERINASGADILLVAMGVPDQDLWLAANRDRLTPVVRMGVGGLFDFFAGNVSRAPLAFRRFGLEWTWRLGNEPIRLGKRYIVGNATFLRNSLRRTLHGHDYETKEPARSLTGLYLGSLLHAGKLQEALRRIIDVAGAACALVVLAPVFMATALSIRLESRGPVLFKQVRVGRNGKTFTMYKFRSMRIGADKEHQLLQGDINSEKDIRFKSKSDPRVTRTGRFIRKASIDELPQLINVLKGEMSMVGPRPALPSEVQHYALGHRDRLLVKPGITGLWQISGRADIDFAGQVELDRQYARQRSAAEDLKIMFKTIPAVVTGRGAY